MERIKIKQGAHTFAERVGVSRDGLERQAANAIKAPGNLGNRGRIEASKILPTDDQGLDVIDAWKGEGSHAVEVQLDFRKHAQVFDVCPVANGRQTGLPSVEIHPQLALHVIVKLLRRAIFVKFVRIDILVHGADVETVLHVARGVDAELQDRPGDILETKSTHGVIVILPGAKDLQKLKQSLCEDLVVSLLLLARLGTVARGAAISWKLDAQPDMLYHPLPLVHDSAKISNAGVV